MCASSDRAGNISLFLFTLFLKQLTQFSYQSSKIETFCSHITIDYIFTAMMREPMLIPATNDTVCNTVILDITSATIVIINIRNIHYKHNTIFLICHLLQDLVVVRLCALAINEIIATIRIR